MSSYSFGFDLAIKAQQLLGAGSANGLIGNLDQQISELINARYRPETGSASPLRVYLDTQSGVGASNNTDYDLIGSLTDAEGTTLNFDDVYLIIVYNRGTSFEIQVGPHPSVNGFGVQNANKGFWGNASDYTVVNPGGGFALLHAPEGVPAAAGSTDVLRVSTVSGSSANAFSVLIVGRDNA